MATRPLEALISGHPASNGYNGSAVIDRPESFHFTDGTIAHQIPLIEGSPLREHRKIPDPLDACFTTLGIDKGEFEKYSTRSGYIIGEAYAVIFKRPNLTFEERTLAYLAQGIIRGRYGDMINTSFQAKPTDYTKTEILEEGKASPAIASMRLTPEQARLREYTEGEMDLQTRQRRFWEVLGGVEELDRKSILPVGDLQRARIIASRGTGIDCTVSING